MPTKPTAHNQPELDARRRERERLRGGKIYGTAWRKLSVQRLKEHPFCVRCKAAGFVVQAQCTDHVVPIYADPTRVYDPTNLQSLCLSCNGKKSFEDKVKYAPRQR